MKGKYKRFLTGDLETVSVHFRLGGVEEPSQVDFEPGSAFTFPSVNWYRDVMTKDFDPAKHVFLIFADNVPKMEKEFLQPIRDSMEQLLNYHIVDEDFANSMLLMSLCKHHVAALSTYSFWGAYLDVKQPGGGGRAIFPANWGSRHFGMPLPYKEWVLKPLD